MDHCMWRMDTSCRAKCFKCLRPSAKQSHSHTHLSRFMKAYTPSQKGSQGQHTWKEPNVIFHPRGVQMEYSEVVSSVAPSSSMQCQHQLARLYCDMLGGKAEIASESCVPRAMKNSLRRPAVLAATGRQLLAWLPAPFLFHYFTFHLEWSLKVSQQAIISPRRLLSSRLSADSEPTRALLTCWWIPRVHIFVYQFCYVFFFPGIVYKLLTMVTVVCRNPLAW